MKRSASIFVAILLSSVLFSCSPSEKKKEAVSEEKEVQVPEERNQSFAAFIPSIVKIETFDGGRILESETAFFVGEQEVVCRLSVLDNATNARITPYDEDKAYAISGYLAVDRINNLALLKVEEIRRKPIPLYSGIAPNTAKSIYLTRPQSNTLPLHTGKVLDFSTISGVRLYRVDNQFRSTIYGTPVFVSNHQCIGLGFAEVVSYENQNMVIPSTYITALLEKKADDPKKLENLQTTTSTAMSEANRKIRGLRIETDLGNIDIRLFDETPQYRDNFIRLVRENYYDSLLIHRVIKGFGIQSGAADTRYAGPDDVVGWKGPGYTLPAHVVPKFFHKRGMIGSPRKPDRGNSKRRSDGSQFYIVTGRVYSDRELDEIEQETGHQFTAEQRREYKIRGGAPHIDGTYTIFGEVTSGLDVADRIVQVETDSDFRPLKDIRVKKITILE
ncbi:peptidylprolyl isomerase [Sunxiuqinia dokdonensis]|uniref:peptidylprolyl isomerase n=1 Tax=Sunxiuqinia dokdonensis TaxID=1409788 RepID=A0A0L8V4K9_9BACT|nr:peptidylprolyl isomerase [Sunxiuqinia dokdonensis]KOH43288.1 peptidylprolyl isomerase [Sunxiuqinia dokdonensis]